MERTETKIIASLLLKLYISGNHINNVISGTHLFHNFFRIIHLASSSFLVHLPRLWHKQLLKPVNGIAVAHTRNIVADHSFL